MIPSAILLTAALLAAPPSPSAPPPASLTIDAVGDGIWLFRPTPDAFAEWRSISNSGAVLLDDGVLIYDSHWTPALAEEAERLLRRHTAAPIRWVVSSHFHSDHTGGLWATRRDVSIIAHRANRERLVEEFDALPQSLPREIERLEGQLADAADAATRRQLGNFLRYSREALVRVESGAPPPFPNVTFERRIGLHHGREAVVLFLGRGHTAGDAVLLLPGDDVAFVGDLLFSGALPNAGDGFTGDWIATLEALLELGVTRFVPGHGPLSTAAEVRSQIAYLRWLRDAVAPYVREARGVEAAQRGLQLPERWSGHAFGFFFPANVAKVYAELAAEAHP